MLSSFNTFNSSSSPLWVTEIHDYLYIWIADYLSDFIDILDMFSGAHPYMHMLSLCNLTLLYKKLQMVFL